MLTMKSLLILILAIAITPALHAQACTPAGDQTSYGTSDTWIGYVYDNMGFTNYSGFVNEGTPGNPNFDESFGGDYVNYATNGCPVYTETFSVRYKLTETFAPGSYQFTVGADDGYRLSLDGGATWVINQFTDQSYNFSIYSATLSGTYNMVIEYYENGAGNRISFAMSAACIATDDQTIYGTGNVWRGYIYKGTNFNTYSGYVTEGTAANANFDESFGGSNTMYNTASCSVQTEGFSARYRLQKNFTGSYSFTVGGDDGYRLSLDGGSTWVIDKWYDQGYNTTLYTTNLSGNYNVVLEYYENGGGNEVSFASLQNILLPVQLLNFNGANAGANIQLTWKVDREVNIDHYILERSTNGIDFAAVGKINASVAANGADKTYSYIDQSPASGYNYYRLQMVDKDNKSATSDVIKVQFAGKNEISIFPSIVNHAPVYLKTTAALQNGSVELFEMNGRKLKEIRLPSQVSAGQTISLSLPESPAGNYVLICKSAGEIKAKQIISIQ